MSRLNQIQQALSSIGYAEFQKLADTFLFEKGYEQINSIGSVAGANKVKVGTPDTLVALPNGDYVFAEHTTQQSSLLEKMKSDLEKCFNEKKTGLPIAKIQKVIFCFTRELEPVEKIVLEGICQKNGVELDLYGLSRMALEIYRNYPGIAKDFLGISIDSGQILTLRQFVKRNNSNKLATRLDHSFHFREKEIESALLALNVDDLCILTGGAGSGKTRLALEICEKFKELHPHWKISCIHGRNKDLWEDLKIYFSKPGNFLIFVDDANRVSRFTYLLDLILDKRGDQEIKVIATVRDYALDKVEKEAKLVGGGRVFKLEPFSEDQIKELIKSEYGIVNYFYLERIANIAHGNPRLAIMAAEVTKDKALESIDDVSTLYKTYFSSIWDDLEREDTDRLLCVAAIVSFFKAVDRSHGTMMAEIEDIFGISASEFRQLACRLHELEWLDMHENEVVRISDQVLSTYLFYLTLFQKQLLSFGVFLNKFYPKHRHRIIDSIYPIISAFDRDQILKMMHPHVMVTWNKLENEFSEDFIPFLEDFWFLDPTRALLWVQGKVSEMKFEPEQISEISFEPSHVYDKHSILSVLAIFGYEGAEHGPLAICLMMDYISKRPTDAPNLLKILLDKYGFKFNSHLWDYRTQRAVIDELLLRIESGNLFFSRLFLRVARAFLATQFVSYSMKDRNVARWMTFDLPNDHSLIALRKAIWGGIFSIGEIEEMHADALNEINHYCKTYEMTKDREIVLNDSRHLLPYLKLVLRPNHFIDCHRMHAYLSLLSRNKIDVPKDLTDEYRNDLYLLSETLIPDNDEWLRSEMSLIEYGELRKKRLDALTASYSFSDYLRFFEHCTIIWQERSRTEDPDPFRKGIVVSLLTLAERNQKLFKKVLDWYLDQKDPFQISGYFLIKNLLENHSFREVIELLANKDFPAKQKWLLYVYEALDISQIEKDSLEYLYQLYKKATPDDIPYHSDYLLQFISLDPRVVIKILTILLSRQKEIPKFSYNIEIFFNPKSDISKHLFDSLPNNYEPLKKAYFIVDSATRSLDYDGFFFNKFLDVTPLFISDYLAWKYGCSENPWLSSSSGERNFSFIWLRHDCFEIMSLVVDTIIKHEGENLFYSSPYLALFFKKISHHDEQINLEKQNQYLLDLIEERSNNTAFMRYLFGVICDFKPERRNQFVSKLVQINQDIKVFSDLPLEPHFWSANDGSWVPTLEKRVIFWKSLLPLMNSVDLLKHRQFINNRILKIETRVERERKNDFLRD